MPNAAGVAALVLCARADMRGRPEALERRLETSARQPFVGPNNAGSTASALDGTPAGAALGLKPSKERPFLFDG